MMQRSAKCIIIFFKALEASWLSSYTPYFLFSFHLLSKRNTHSVFLHFYTQILLFSSILKFFFYFCFFLPCNFLCFIRYGLIVIFSLYNIASIRNERSRDENKKVNEKSDVQSGCSKVRDCVHNVLNKNALQSWVLKKSTRMRRYVSIFLFNVRWRVSAFSFLEVKHTHTQWRNFSMNV